MSVPAPAPDLVSTADLYDEYGENLDSCDVQFVQFGGRRHFRGTASTIRVHDDNILVKEAVAEPGHGRVLVVDGAGSCRSALLGDNMAKIAAANGWEGVIIHGAVRDVVALRAIDLGIKAVGSNPRRSRKDRTGLRDVPVSFGGATITPGAEIVSDDDGLVVLPSNATRDVSG
jgi:regulator of ribonuclease activity A